MANGNGTSFRGPLNIRTTNNGQVATPDVPAIDASGYFVGPGIAASAAPAPVAGVFSTIQVAKAIYDFSVDGGAVSTITPAKNTTIPANAILLGGFAKASAAAALTAIAGTTISIGTSAGSSATALLGTTAGAIANWAAAAIIPLVPTLAVPVQLTAAGLITFSPGTHAVTAGIVEIYVFFVVPTNA